MELDIIKIGNSKGIRIPTSILKECGFEKKVSIEIHGDSLTLRPARRPREGWEEAFKRMRANDDDALIYDDSLDLHLLPEWKDEGDNSNKQ